MATAQLPSGKLQRWAKSPFYFNTAAHLLRIEREQARSLGELLEGLRTCSDGSIFQHTFRTLQEHHFIREGFSNDFAHWAFEACNEIGLAERLASLDVREFTSIPALRERIIAIIEDYLKSKSARPRPDGDGAVLFLRLRHDRDSHHGCCPQLAGVRRWA